MAPSLAIRPEYAALYSIEPSSVPLPAAGETIREYVRRAGLGREENILPIVNDRARPWNYLLADGDRVEIYPMSAGG